GNLRYIKETTQGGVQIGALTKLAEIAESDLLAKKYPMLVQAVKMISSPELRNASTLGGDLLQEVWCQYLRGGYSCWRNGGYICYGAIGDNSYYHSAMGGRLCYAVYPGDAAPALITLDATVKIAGPSGIKEMSVEQLVPGDMMVDGRIQSHVVRFNEILTEVVIPPPHAGFRASFEKLRPRGVWDFAMACRSDHPVCAALVASRHFLNGAATPPLRGGEWEGEVNMTKTFVGGVIVTVTLGILVPSTPSRLVSIQRLPEERGQMCAWEEPIASSQPENLFASIQREVGPSYAMAFLQQRGRDPLPAINEVTRTPEFRTLADTYPTYTSVGINLATDEVVLQDNNLWSTRVFNRLDSTPPGAEMTQPKRIIQGRNTHIQYNNGLYIDQKNGDIYSVESDTGDRMVVFARDAQGDVAPKRELHTLHRSYAIAVDEDRQ